MFHGVRLGIVILSFTLVLRLCLYLFSFRRMHTARKEYLQNKKGIILLQCCVRRMAARKELKRLKVTYNFHNTT